MSEDLISIVNRLYKVGGGGRVSGAPRSHFVLALIGLFGIRVM